MSQLPISARGLELAVSQAMQLRALLGEDADESLLIGTIEGETGLLNYVDRLGARLVSDWALIAMAERRLAALKQREALIARTLQQILEATGVTRVERAAMVLRLQANPPSVEILDETLIPPELMRHPDPPAPTPMKREIAAKLKAGEAVPGAQWAAKTHHLRVQER